MERSGYELPLLLVGAFKAIIDELHDELARRGHERARPIHGFALQAIGTDGVTTAELGRRLGVSKQAAAKTATSLEDAGYLTRSPDAADARARILTRTPHAVELLRLSAEILDRVRRRAGDAIGEQRIRDLEDALAVLGGESTGSFHNLPGWLQ